MFRVAEQSALARGICAHLIICEGVLGFSSVTGGSPKGFLVNSIDFDGGVVAGSPCGASHAAVSVWPVLTVLSVIWGLE